MKTIIGVIGRLASGKDTAIEYISQKLNLPIYIISSELKDIAKEQNIEINRKNLCELGKNIAAQHGDEYLAQRILDKNQDNNIILVAGMRQLGQIHLFQKSGKLILINIYTDQKIRYERMLKRNLNGDPKNWKGFIDTENIDDGGQGVQSISECEKYSTYTIQNNLDKAHLFSQIDKIIKK